MRRTLVASPCAVVAALALSAGCSGGGKTTKQPDTTPEQPKTAGTPESRELDKLMRTRMNVSYSQLVYLVFHSDSGPDFDLIAEEQTKLSQAIDGVLHLQPPPVVQSDQARQVYVDYNTTLRRDGERFAEATAKRDLKAMSSSLTKMGETCSACHHFFRVNVKDAAE